MRDLKTNVEQKHARKRNNQETIENKQTADVHSDFAAAGNVEMLRQFNVSRYNFFIRPSHISQ